MNFWKRKDKSPYPRSFAKRLTWRIMFTLFCVMTIVSLIIFLIAWFTTFAQAYLLTDRILLNKRANVERVLAEVYAASVNTVPDIENSLQRPDRVAAIMKRIVELNPSIRSCGISFRQSYYPQKGRWYCPYAVRGDSDSIVMLTTIGGLQQDYLQQPWFTEAMKSKEAYWSKPFFADTDKKTPLVAYLMPIRDERDSTVAVLGVDVSLFKLFPQYAPPPGSTPDDATPWDAENSLYYFAVDSTGTFLMHPDVRRVVNKSYFDYARQTPGTQDDELGQDMTSGKTRPTGGHMDEIEGETVLVTYHPIEHTPWSMALVVPYIFIKFFAYVFGGFLLLFILIGLIVVFFAGRRGIKKASRPLRQLAASADEVAKGHFDTPLPDINSRDEIHLVRDSFENMQHSLTKYVDELREATAQKAAIENEMKVAHDIQMSMLPKTFPPYPERTDIDIFGSLTPAKGVGGDLFDFYIRDEKLFFCIGDVSGKGVPASLYMAVTRSLFRNVSAHVSEPALIVSALNKAQSEGNDTNMFVTLFVGVLDLHTGLLTYCNAGHNAPLLVGRDVGTLSCDPNLPIGILSDFNFSQQHVSIDSGTTVFLFTDGLNEAEDSTHAQFGDMRIWELAQRLLSEGRHQPQTFIDTMVDSVHSFVGDAEQSDDLTMLAIQYKR